jgi:hypothetical protein
MDRRRVKRLPQLAAALIAVLVSVGSEARAGVLAWNDTGSSLSNCVNISGTPCGANTGTSLGLSAFSLTINPITNSGITVPPTTTTGTLTELQLTTAANPSGSATFNYNILVNFTTPAGNTFTDTLGLAMTTAGSGSNSSETLTGFSGLPASFTLPGFVLSNFHFVSNGAGGAFPGTGGPGSWTVTGGNGGNQTSPTLDLVADVTATAAPVPEPGSFAVLGTALVGFGIFGYRRRRQSCARRHATPAGVA